jgi:hypothetical protein
MFSVNLCPHSASISFMEDNKFIHSVQVYFPKKITLRYVKYLLLLHYCKSPLQFNGGPFRS